MDAEGLWSNLHVGSIGSHTYATEAAVIFPSCVNLKSFTSHFSDFKHIFCTKHHSGFILESCSLPYWFAIVLDLIRFTAFLCFEQNLEQSFVILFNFFLFFTAIKRNIPKQPKLKKKNFIPKHLYVRHCLHVTAANYKDAEENSFQNVLCTESHRKDQNTIYF